MARRMFRGAAALIRHAKTLVVIPLVAFVLVGGVYWGWQSLRRSGYRTDEYGVQPRDITLVPEPKWIESQSLLGDVVRDASLDDRLSLLDEHLTERVSLAFRAHPWVASVAAVEKSYPAHIQVTLVYREPVAVVSCDSRYFPVDGQGIRLPEKDLTDAQLRQFARILGVPPSAHVAHGDVWEDPRVLGGAQIAATFGSLWQEFGLLAIEPSAQPIHGDANVYTYQLVSKSGMRIPWGPQYSQENPDEPSAVEKRDRLKAYVDEHGALDGAMPPRTAVRPEVGDP